MGTGGSGGEDGKGWGVRIVGAGPGRITDWHGKSAFRMSGDLGLAEIVEV